MAAGVRIVAVGSALAGVLLLTGVFAQDAGNPDPAEALFQRGWASHSSGDFGEAVKAYRELAEKHPKSEWAARGLGCMGWDLMILRRYDEAIEVFQRVMREYPESKYSSGSLVAGQAAYSIVHCLYAKGDIDQAMAALDKALDLCPDARSGDNDGALRSEIFLNMMESEEEKRAAGQVMADGRPSDPGKYLYLRACCMKWDEALRAYQKFISLYPKHPFAGAALASTARSLSALGLCDEAIARYRRILDEYPDAQYLTGKGVAPRAAWSLACCYYVKGDMKSAKAAFDFALEKYPDTNVRRKLYGEVFLTLVKKLETAADEPQKVPPK